VVADIGIGVVIVVTETVLVFSPLRELDEACDIVDCGLVCELVTALTVAALKVLFVIVP